MERNPVPLSEQEAKRIYKLRFTDPTLVLKVKQQDCVFYRSCLDIADKNDWPQFCCTACTAFKAISLEQKKWDFEQCLAIDDAIDNVENTGNAGRRRGVKPGADSRPDKRKELYCENSDLSDGALSEAFPDL